MPDVFPQENEVRSVCYNLVVSVLITVAVALLELGGHKVGWGEEKRKNGLRSTAIEVMERKDLLNRVCERQF